MSYPTLANQYPTATTAAVPSYPTAAAVTAGTTTATAAYPYSYGAGYGYPAGYTGGVDYTQYATTAAPYWAGQQYYGGQQQYYGGQQQYYGGAAAGYYGAGYGVAGAAYGYGVAGAAHENVVSVPVRVPVIERRAAAPTVEKIVQVPVPVESAPQYVQMVQYVPVPHVQYVERPVVQYVEKEVKQVQYVDKVVERVVLSCYGCGGDIEGAVFEAQGKKWHRECYVECAGCGGWIESNAFIALERSWHFECFVCFKCGKACGNSKWIVHEGKPAHEECVKPAGPPGMAMRQTINVKTIAEAERLDAMDGVIDGKYNGTAIACPDPEWQKRWAGVVAWEVSDERMAAHLDGSGSGQFDGKTDDGSRIVVSKDGAVDGNV